MMTKSKYAITKLLAISKKTIYTLSKELCILIVVFWCATIFILTATYIFFFGNIHVNNGRKYK
jgi:hypothetical protein